MWSKEDVDTWIAVLAHVCREAYENPDIVKSAPHDQVVGRIDFSPLNDPQRWAMTYRAWKRKEAARIALADAAE
jgi:glycine dehydrogenase subunit 2